MGETGIPLHSGQVVAPTDAGGYSRTRAGDRETNPTGFCAGWPPDLAERFRNQVEMGGTIITVELNEGQLVLTPLTIAVLVPVAGFRIREVVV